MQNGAAIGQGTAVAQAPPGIKLPFAKTWTMHLIFVHLQMSKGGFGLALGVGGAIQTPLGNLAIGEGESLAFGK